MDIKVYIDNQCGYNFKADTEKYNEIYEKGKRINGKNKLIIVFSNNLDFVKGICKMYPKPSVVINITENLSEYHVSNVLKYVSDICYFNTNVEIIVNKILKTYMRLCKRGNV